MKPIIVLAIWENAHGNVVVDLIKGGEGDDHDPPAARYDSVDEARADLKDHILNRAGYMLAVDITDGETEQL